MKEGGKMEWIERLNEAMDYIEKNICGEINSEELGRICCCSSYHFQRMFGFIAGIPLSEYIRRRKMTLAAADIQSGMKVIDAALKYGYASPTAFNRAFRSVHKTAPSKIKDGAVIKSFSPLVFKITVKGVQEMNYRIEKKKSFKIIGKSFSLEKEIEKNFEKVPEKWNAAINDGIVEKLLTLANGEPKGILGVCVGGYNDSWKYYIAASSSKKEDGFEEYTVPELEWAVFSGKGSCPKAVQELESRINSEWLPSSGYEYSDGPDIEVYLTQNYEDAEFEVWIPVNKKKSCF